MNLIIKTEYGNLAVTVEGSVGVYNTATFNALRHAIDGLEANAEYATEAEWNGDVDIAEIYNSNNAEMDDGFYSLAHRDYFSEAYARTILAQEGTPSDAFIVHSTITGVQKAVIRFYRK